jgi:hypothetical protein
MPKAGYKQSDDHKDKKAKATTGKKNGRWNGGTRTYRKTAGCCANDGSVVHHKDGSRANNKKSNLQVLNDAPKSKGFKKAGRRTTALHESLTKRRAKKK